MKEEVKDEKMEKIKNLIKTLPLGKQLDLLDWLVILTEPFEGADEW